jgi:hypothetical protein
MNFCNVAKFHQLKRLFSNPLVLISVRLILYFLHTQLGFLLSPLKSFETKERCAQIVFY